MLEKMVFRIYFVKNTTTLTVAAIFVKIFAANLTNVTEP